jgi:hypothetical protein
MYLAWTSMNRQLQFSHYLDEHITLPEQTTNFERIAMILCMPYFLPGLSITIYRDKLPSIPTIRPPGYSDIFYCLFPSIVTKVSFAFAFDFGMADTHSGIHDKGGCDE